MTTSSQKRESRSGARAKKISITLDESIVAAMRGRMKRSRGNSLSATIAEALERDLRREKLAQLIAKYEAEHGAITEAELREARRVWQA